MWSCLSTAATAEIRRRGGPGAVASLPALNGSGHHVRGGGPESSQRVTRGAVAAKEGLSRECVDMAGTRLQPHVHVRASSKAHQVAARSHLLLSLTCSPICAPALVALTLKEPRVSHLAVLLLDTADPGRARSCVHRGFDSMPCMAAQGRSTARLAPDTTPYSMPVVDQLRSWKQGRCSTRSGE